MTSAPLWHELLFLMVHGPDHAMRGRIRHEDGETPSGVGWMSSVAEPHPTPARAGQGEVSVWVWGDRVRLADNEGRVTLICDGRTAWSFDTPAQPPRETPRRSVLLGLDGTELLERATAERWQGDDFTQPTGPATAVSFLGRNAWEVELAPPPHKPYPLKVVIDAETGMLLQQRNDQAGFLSEWVDLHVSDSLDSTLFAWDGPVISWEEQAAAHRRVADEEQRQRERWASDHLGTRSLRVTIHADITVHRVEEDGTLHASLEPIGHLVRSPRADGTSARPAADNDQANDDETYRWSDARWDWTLHTWGVTLAADALEDLRAQLDADV